MLWSGKKKPAHQAIVGPWLELLKEVKAFKATLKKLNRYSLVQNIRFLMSAHHCTIQAFGCPKSWFRADKFTQEDLTRAFQNQSCEAWCLSGIWAGTGAQLVAHCKRHLDRIIGVTRMITLKGAAGLANRAINRIVIAITNRYRTAVGKASYLTIDVCLRRCLPNSRCLASGLCYNNSLRSALIQG